MIDLKAYKEEIGVIGEENAHRKVPVIHQVDVPMGGFSLWRNMSYFVVFDQFFATFGIQSFFILPPCGTFEHTCGTI